MSYFDAKEVHQRFAQSFGGIVSSDRKPDGEKEALAGSHRLTPPQAEWVESILSNGWRMDRVGVIQIIIDFKSE